MRSCIDASVFVSAIRSIEVNHQDSVAFFRALTTVQPEIHCPVLALAETIAAVARTVNQPSLVLEARRIIEDLLGITLVEISRDRASRAADIAANHHLRGADSIYIALAKELGATLIARDKEMLQCAPAIVPTQSPADWIAAHRGS